MDNLLRQASNYHSFAVMRNITIVRTDRMGDLVQTIPMATAIKAAMPEARITFMVRSYTAPLLALTPDIDDLVLYDPNFSLLKKIQVFQQTEADVMFFPSPRPDLAVAARLAGVKKRVGTGYRWYSPLFTNPIYAHRKTAEHHEAEYNVQMLQEIGIEPAHTPLPHFQLRVTDLERANENLFTLFGNPVTKFVVLHISTSGSTVTWKPSQFALFAEWVARDLTLPILLTGIETDREMLLSIAEVIKSFGGDVKLFLGAPLTELAGVLSQAALVVSNSTGPGHLAAALGTRTIGLFPLARALSKERWGFRGVRVRNIAPEEAPKPTCPMCKECSCMDHITVARVIHAAKDLLENS